MKKLLYSLMAFLCFSTVAVAQKSAKASVDSFLAQCHVLLIEVIPVKGNLGLNGKKPAFQFEANRCLGGQKKYNTGDSVQVRYDVWINNPDSGDWVLTKRANNGVLITGYTNYPYITEYYKGIIRTIRPLTTEEKERMRREMLEENE
jgi:hypothetical protein